MKNPEQDLPNLPEIPQYLADAYDLPKLLCNLLSNTNYTNPKRINSHIEKIATFFRYKIGLDNTIILLGKFAQNSSNGHNFLTQNVEDAQAYALNPPEIKNIVSTIILAHYWIALLQSTYEKEIEPWIEISRQIKTQVLIRQTGLEIIRDNKILAFHAVHKMPVTLNKEQVETSIFDFNGTQHLSFIASAFAGTPCEKKFKAIRHAILITHLNLHHLLDDEVRQTLGCDMLNYIDALCSFYFHHPLAGEEAVNPEDQSVLALFEQQMWVYFSEFVKNPENCNVGSIRALIPSAEQVADFEEQLAPERLEFQLQKAIETGNEEVMVNLLHHRDDINDGLPNTLTPLMTAAKEGQLELVKKLVAMGASIAVRHSKVGTALHVAAEACQKEIMAYFYHIGVEPLDHLSGYDVLDGLYEELSAAIRSGDEIKVKLLIEDLHLPLRRFIRKSSVLFELYYEDGKGFIATAIASNHFTIAYYLCKRMPGFAENDGQWQLSMRDINKSTIEKVLIKAVSFGYLTQIEFILNHFLPVNLNTKDSNERSLIILATIEGQEEVLRLLLNWPHNFHTKSSVNVNWVDKFWHCAIDYAHEAGKQHLVDLLIEHGSVMPAKHQPAPLFVNEYVKDFTYRLFNRLIKKDSDCLFDLLITTLKSSVNQGSFYSKLTVHLDKDPLKIEQYNKVYAILGLIKWTFELTATFSCDENKFSIEIDESDKLSMIRCLNDIKAILNHSELVDDDKNRLIYAIKLHQVYYQRPFNWYCESDIEGLQMATIETFFKMLYDKLGGTASGYTYQTRTNHGPGWLKIDGQVFQFIQQRLFHNTNAVNDTSYHAISVRPESESSDYDVESNDWDSEDKGCLLM